MYNTVEVTYLCSIIRLVSQLPYPWHCLSDAIQVSYMWYSICAIEQVSYPLTPYVQSSVGAVSGKIHVFFPPSNTGTVPVTLCIWCHTGIILVLLYGWYSTGTVPASSYVRDNVTYSGYFVYYLAQVAYLLLNFDCVVACRFCLLSSHVMYLLYPTMCHKSVVF